MTVPAIRFEAILGWLELAVDLDPLVSRAVRGIELHGAERLASASTTKDSSRSNPAPEETRSNKFCLSNAVSKGLNTRPEKYDFPQSRSTLFEQLELRV